jgi:hypothetical protein
MLPPGQCLGLKFRLDYSAMLWTEFAKRLAEDGVLRGS